MYLQFERSCDGIAMFAHFKEYHGNHKNFKSLYGFGGRCIKIRDACMDVRSITLSLFTLKAPYLAK